MLMLFPLTCMHQNQKDDFVKIDYVVLKTLYIIGFSYIQNFKHHFHKILLFN